MATTKDKHTTAKAHFTPSVNIVRDRNKQLNYIPTPNGKVVFNQLINNYQKGTRSFNIIGAYGIGKSAFLWALDKQLNGEQQIFTSGKPLTDLKGFETMGLIGEPVSLLETFSEAMGLSHRKNVRSSDILHALDAKYKKLAAGKRGLIIFIDEFGKFLEYASENTPSRELYFIQQLAEYVNDVDKEIFLITTLHQDFNGYARELTPSQQNEWDKVKGRLKEVAFNEPVEQLVFLAAERLKKISPLQKNANFKKLFNAIDKAKVFPLKDYFNEQVASDVLPFDMLSIAALTLALQKYGQNERSLFSFIESSDHFGLADFNAEKSPYFNLVHVYDYLIHNHYSFLTTKFNPHYTNWSAIRTGIEKVEGIVPDHISESIMVVKTIGLLNIFAPASSRLDLAFLSDYCRFSLGIKQPEEIIRTLVSLRIVRFVKHLNKYILFDGTDLDIELAIDEAGNLVEKVTSVIHHLNQYFDFPYISAKAAHYQFGTPRFFAFHVTEKPAVHQPVGDIDGYINLVFSEHTTEKEMRNYSRNCKHAALFGWYSNTAEIRNQIFEIDKIKRVKEDNHEDKVAVRELDKILQHQVRLLNHYVFGNIYSSASPVKWYVDGEEKEIVDRKTFNRILSEICYTQYPGVPVYRNEMVNKSKLSSPIASARKNFIGALVSNWHEKDFGFDENKFPPEKTIYLSLVRESGMHYQLEDGGYALGQPTNPDYELERVWKACEDFMDSTIHGKRNVFELVQILSDKPFKLKNGFIEFWLIVYLFLKRNEYALFHEDAYVPFISQETLELTIKDPKEYTIKKFDIEGVRLDIFNSYRKLLDLSINDKPIGETFIETIRPFLTFYKKLPAYAKHTQTLSSGTRALRDAIATAKDPEESFFVTFPAAMGFDPKELQKDVSTLSAYSDQLEVSLAEIRGCYNALISRVEDVIKKEITGPSLFTSYREDLRNRFLNVKKHLLLHYQKVFYQRLYSEIDDNTAWLNSMVQACIGKPLEDITDTEEKVLYEKLKNIVHELDNLDELGRLGFDENKEIAFKLEVTSFVEGLNKNLVRLPIGKNTELIQLQSVIKARLTEDKQLNIATLAKILEDLLKDEKS
jgi:hypothetical protein